MNEDAKREAFNRIERSQRTWWVDFSAGWDAAIEHERRIRIAEAVEG